MTIEFREFPKIARLAREIIITEKIDGTNAQVYVDEDGTVLAGSRSRWITPDSDNFGFALWVQQHADELRKLGPGHHFGEWWGMGIQRGYGLKERRFSLFNVQRWCPQGSTPQIYPTGDPRITRTQEELPGCCGLVPVLYRGEFLPHIVDAILHNLKTRGSQASPDFMNPEGIVIFHTAANILFKQTLEKDEVPKALAQVIA